MFEPSKAEIFVDVPYLQSRVFRHIFIPICIAAITFTMICYGNSTKWTAEDEEIRAYAQEHYEWIQSYRLVEKSKSGTLLDEHYTFELAALNESSESARTIDVSRRDYRLYDKGGTVYLIDIDGTIRILRVD